MHKHALPRDKYARAYSLARSINLEAELLNGRILSRNDWCSWPATAKESSRIRTLRARADRLYKFSGLVPGY